MQRVPNKLDERSKAAILGAIRLGNYRCHAAAAAGIDERTLYRWLAKGKKEQDDPESVMGQFYNEVRQAEGAWVSTAVGEIRLAGKTQWTAIAWLLERRYPEKFGRDGREIKELRKQLEELTKQFEAMQLA